MEKDAFPVSIAKAAKRIEILDQKHKSYRYVLSMKVLGQEKCCNLKNVHFEETGPGAKKRDSLTFRNYLPPSCFYNRSRLS